MANPNPFTPEEVAQILEAFFAAVGTRQYIGARYVPIFGRKGETSIIWDNSAPYEPLTIVLYQGNSFTSRQYVPEGVEITNEEFWANTGNYNAQIEQYRRETAEAKAAADAAQADIDALDTKLAQYVTPDDYDGSDVQKLQQAFDAISATGGIIVLNRSYTLSEPIIIRQDSDARNAEGQRLVTRVMGIGDHSTIIINGTGFKGVDITQHCGGILFDNVRFVGTDHTNSIIFDMNDLLRIYLIGCSFDNAKYAFKCDANYMQDVHAVQTTFTNIELCIYSEPAVFALTFMSCFFEGNLYGQQAMVLGTPTQKPDAHNVAFVGCVFEGFATNGIEVYQRTMGMLIEGCYFESNGTYDIMLDNNGTTSINDCYFNGGTDKCALKLPKSTGGSVPRIVARGNYVHLGYFIDDDNTENGTCFIDSEATLNREGTRNTLKNNSDGIINVNDAGIRYVELDESFSATTTLADTGITITIPPYSIVNLNVIARNVNTRPLAVAVSTLANETGIVRNVLAHDSQDTDIYDVSAQVVTTNVAAITLHVYAKYAAAGTNEIRLRGTIRRRLAR